METAYMDEENSKTRRSPSLCLKSILVIPVWPKDCGYVAIIQVWITPQCKTWTAKKSHLVVLSKNLVVMTSALLSCYAQLVRKQHPLTGNTDHGILPTPGCTGRVISKSLLCTWPGRRWLPSFLFDLIFQRQGTDMLWCGPETHKDRREGQEEGLM